jgi:hypothetical protein
MVNVNHLWWMEILSGKGDAMYVQYGIKMIKMQKLGVERFDLEK